MADTLFAAGTVVASTWLNEVNTDTHALLTGVVGIDAITATGPISMTAYETGQRFFFNPAANNTTNVTININGLGNRAVTKLGNILLIAQDLLVGTMAEIVYDGLGFQLLNPQTFNLTQSVPAANITGQVAIANGGTGASTANAAFTALSAGVTLSFRNKIINGNFNINQRAAVSGTSLALNAYFLDRWRSATATNAVTWAASGNGNIVTIPATEEIEQVIEGNNIEGGVYTLSWTGTATAQVNGSAITNGGQTGSLPANTNVTVKFLAGTVSLVQFEKSTVATVFEQRPPPIETILCERYYQTSYPAGTAHGTAALNGDVANGIAIDANTMVIFGMKHAVPLRIAGAGVTTFNPNGGAGGNVRETNTGNNVAIAGPNLIGSKGGGLTYTSAGAFTAGRLYDWHWATSAEL